MDYSFYYKNSAEEKLVSTIVKSFPNPEAPTSKYLLLISLHCCAVARKYLFCLAGRIGQKSFSWYFKESKNLLIAVFIWFSGAPIFYTWLSTCSMLSNMNWYSVLFVFINAANSLPVEATAENLPWTHPKTTGFHGSDCWGKHRGVMMLQSRT